MDVSVVIVVVLSFIGSFDLFLHMRFVSFSCSLYATYCGSVDL